LIRDLLGIPDRLEAYDMMPVGYPATSPRPKLMREKESMIHYDYCGENDFRTYEEVKDYTGRNKQWITATHRRPAD